MGSGTPCFGLFSCFRGNPKANENNPTDIELDNFPPNHRYGGGHNDGRPPTRRPFGSGSLLPRNSSSYLTATSSQIDHPFISCDIWAAAYDELKKDPNLQPLVNSYEDFYNTLLWPKALIDEETDAYGNPLPKVNDSATPLPEEPVRPQRPRASTYMSQLHFRKAAQMYIDVTKLQDKTMGVASSALQFIAKIKSVVDSVLASSPSASMAWAGVCLVVLPIVINHAEQIASKQTGFNYVMSRFSWYDQVLDLLNRNHWKSQQNFVVLRQGIRDEIINLYKLLIEYQLRAYYAYCRPLVTLSRDVLKLDDWDGMIVSIKEAEKRLQDYMDLNFEQHLLDKLHGMSEDARRRHRKEVSLKFKFPEELPYDVYQAYLDGIDDPQKGTGEGVFSHPDFTKWASADSGLFVLSGIPGSGKSVIAKSLLTALPKLRATTVCSFFFKDNANGQNLATTALCRILDELFGARIALIDDIIPRLEHLLAQEVRCNLDLLWNILDDATDDTDPGAFTIVLDGLDECDPEGAEDLCDKINTYLQKPTARLKFFITARPLLSALNPFDPAHTVILKSNEDPYCLEHLSKDIQQVVASRFEVFARVCIRDNNLKKELLALVQPKEERTYLYTKLLFDFLDLKIKDGLPRVPRDWVKVFKTLPATVKEEYLVFLGRVRESHRKDVKLMLQMVVAAARPLTVREINIALNIRDCKDGNIDGLGLQQEESFRDWILDACRFFLDVYNGRVYFIHQTAKDYLLADKDDQSSIRPRWLGNFTMEQCHQTMAQSCVAYLMLPFETTSRFKKANSAPERPVNAGSVAHMWDMADLEFANYALTNYRAHITASGIQVSTAVGQEALGVSDTPSLPLRQNCDWLFWTDGLVTTVRLDFPPRMMNVNTLARLLGPMDPDATTKAVMPDQAPHNASKQPDLIITVNKEANSFIVLDNKAIFTDTAGLPVSRVPSVPTKAHDSVERVADVLYSISTFRAISALADYQRYGPIPEDWFAVHVTAPSLGPVEANQPRKMVIKQVTTTTTHQRAQPLLRVGHGDTMTYILSNRTESVPVCAYMFTLNSSWTIGTPVWRELILPRQEKRANLAMTVPRKVNPYDEHEGGVDDEFVIVFVVGDGCRGGGGGRGGGVGGMKAGGGDTVEEWLKRVYLPPVILEGESGRVLERGAQVPFLPPPNWLVWRFKVKTLPRLGGL